MRCLGLSWIDLSRMFSSHPAAGSRDFKANPRSELPEYRLHHGAPQIVTRGRSRQDPSND
jgi:hypothetical protein